MWASRRSENRPMDRSVTVAAQKRLLTAHNLQSRARQQAVPQRVFPQPARSAAALLLVALLCTGAAAQEASVGVAMPVTITGGALYTHRGTVEEPEASPVSGAFHAALYPSLKLGPHWFVYSAIHVRS